MQARARTRPQIHARREHRSLAAQDQHAHFLVGRRGFYGAAQLADQLAVQRVPLVSPIEDQMSHGAAILCAQKCHVGSA
jgi:hypothetical protein